MREGHCVRSTGCETTAERFELKSTWKEEMLPCKRVASRDCHVQSCSGTRRNCLRPGITKELLSLEGKQHSIWNDKQSAAENDHQQVGHSVTASSEICCTIKSQHEPQYVGVNESVTQKTSCDHQIEGNRPRSTERGCSGCAVGFNVQWRSLAFCIGFP